MTMPDAAADGFAAERFGADLEADLAADFFAFAGFVLRATFPDLRTLFLATRLADFFAFFAGFRAVFFEPLLPGRFFARFAMVQSPRLKFQANGMPEAGPAAQRQPAPVVPPRAF
jgi:hypothetical protein